ncbi:MAG: branched-chain amino acid ABC transporter permease [Actinomycetota bacterium]
MTWVNAIIQGILLGGFFALFATGLSLAFGVMRFVNLAHGDLAILAAYFGVSTSDALDVNPFVTLLIVVPLMAALGYALQRFVFNFAIGDDPLPSILVTFGLSVVIQNALLEIYSADSQGLDAGAFETESLQLNDDIAIGVFPLTVLIVAIVVLGGLGVFISRSRIGRAFRATSDDPSTARLMGINDRNIYGVVMAIAFATVALAGIALGVRQTFGPNDGPALLLVGFESVVIGGLGSLWGTLVGGVIMGVAQTLGNQLDVEFGVLNGPLLGHLIFLLVLLVRPTGLLGGRRA